MRARSWLSLLSVVVVVQASVTGVALADDPKIQTYEKGYRFDKNGWIYVHIEGEPYERGFQHGYLVAQELGRILETAKFLTYHDTGKHWSFFTDAAEKLWTKHIDKEFLDEIKGIAAGARERGVKITWQDVMTWNGQEELMDYWWPNALPKYRYMPKIGAPRDHCSAFLATKPYTKGGRIVMAHNSWNNFEWGQFANVILDIVPAKGHRIFMQSEPGYIDSMADFFVTDAGIMGTETTIGGFSLYDDTKAPEFSRVRQAMQYADDLDQFVEILRHENNGGYANSWLLADIGTGEIMRFELGLRFWNVERKKEGYFVGFNAPLDPRIRNLECSNTGYCDIRRHQGARQVRLPQLMAQHKGHIDVEVGQAILADHYDVYTGKANHPCSRTVDGHYELDAREYMSDPSRPKPYRPRGAVDGKVMDSDLAAKLGMHARWGNSSGLPFDADKFLQKHPQWNYLAGYLASRPSQPWTAFVAGQKP